MANSSTPTFNIARAAGVAVSTALVGVASYLPLSLNASTIPGEIILVAGQCPGGFLPADGSDVDLSAYPELAAVVQNSYGGGSTTGFIGLPGVQAPTLTNAFDYVYQDAIALEEDAESYLVKVSDPRGQRTVFEVELASENGGGNSGGGSNGGVKPIKGPIAIISPGVSQQSDPSDPQNFVRYVNSFERATETRVETYAVRTKSGFSLPNGEVVERGTEGSFWFGAYCTGNNGTCSNTNKAIETIDLESLNAEDLDDNGRPISSSSITGDGSMAGDFQSESDLPSDFAPFQPQYCVAVGGDTAPLVEVGLKYDPSAETLEFARVDVSGLKFDDLPSDCFANGNLCLDALAETNPGITRPNIAFRLVGENVCPAVESVAQLDTVSCDTVSGSTTQVRELQWDIKRVDAFCSSIDNAQVHSSGGFCESVGSGQQKIGKKDCKAAGGVNGDRSNQMANSPICLPPDNAYRLVTATNANPDAVCEVTNYVDVRYPGELKLSGVQVSSVTGTYPSDGDWGDDYDSFADGTKKFTQASFTYITKRDENGRPGFVAADLVDERTLILENRNVAPKDFSYRVQAECGEGDSVSNVYYDPQIRHNGGGGGFPY